MEAVFNHYKLRDEIADLQRQNDKRKHLIMLSVQKVALLSQAPKKTVKGNNESSRLKTQINDYELYTNKLKQEHSTKVKIQEAKLEALKEENAKLKAQMKSYKDSASFSRGSGVGGSILSRGANSPFSLPKFNFRKDDMDDYLNPLGITKPISKLDKILTPVTTRVKKPKRTYITSKNINQFDLLMNPGLALNKNENILADLSTTKNSSTPPLSESSSSKASAPPSSAGDKLFSSQLAKVSSPVNSHLVSEAKPSETVPPVLDRDTPIESNKSLPLIHPTSIDAKSTPIKDSSRKSFIQEFDKSSDSNSPSPEFTPSRGKPAASLATITKSGLMSENKRTSFSVTEDDTFASANSSMLAFKTDDDNAKKKKKKLQLWKSNASKIDLTADKKSKSFGLEDENLNSLNYYQDDNFAVGNDESPLKASKKRPAEDKPLRDNIKKKKRNIFKID